MALKFFGEWAPDKANLAEYLAVAKNCYPRSDYYAPLYDVSAISTALNSMPIAAISTAPINHVTEIYAATANNLWQFDAATLGWTNRSRGPAYVTEAPMQWEFAQYKDRVLAVSLENLLQQKQIGVVGPFADVTDAPKGHSIGIVKQFVMVGDINDPTDGYVPYRVRWSAINNPLNWPLAGLNAAFAVQSDQQDLRAESGAVTGIYGTNVGIILQKFAVVRAEYVGSPLVFTFTEVDSSHGMAYKGGAAVAGNRVFYLSETGFFVTDGNGESQPIGNERVDKWFYANLNASLAYQVRAAHWPQQRLIAWTFPSSLSSTNDTVILYNYEANRWSYANIATSFALFGRTQGYTMDNIDGFGTVDTIAAGFDSSFWEGGNSLPFVFTSDYRLATLNGTALNALIETNDLTFDGRRFFLTGVRPLVGSNAIGGMTVDAAANSGAVSTAFTWAGPRNRHSGTGLADFRLSGHFIRFRFQLTDDFDKFQGFDAVGGVDDGAR